LLLQYLADNVIISKLALTFLIYTDTLDTCSIDHSIA
jgi:hypothetical protein